MPRLSKLQRRILAHFYQAEEGRTVSTDITFSLFPEFKKKGRSPRLRDWGKDRRNPYVRRDFWGNIISSVNLGKIPKPWKTEEYHSVVRSWKTRHNSVLRSLKNLQEKGLIRGLRIESTHIQYSLTTRGRRIASHID